MEHLNENTIWEIVIETHEKQFHESALDHLSGCTSCQKKYEEFCLLHQSLNDLRQFEPSQQFVHEVLSKLPGESAKIKPFSLGALPYAIGFLIISAFAIGVIGVYQSVFLIPSDFPISNQATLSLFIIVVLVFIDYWRKYKWGRVST